MRSLHYLFAVGFVLALIHPARAADSTRFLMPTPPDKALIVNLGGKEFFQGAVYLPTHDDTLTLLPLGFRGFVFDGRTPGSVRYHAMWPKSALKDSLPGSISIDYDLAPPDTNRQDDDDLSPHPPVTPPAEGNK